MADPIKSLAKRERRKSRITAERLAESRQKAEVDAYQSAQVSASDNPIRISDIPYTPFKG